MYGFLMGSNIFHGFGFGTAKPDGFIPGAIPTHAAEREFEGGRMREEIQEREDGSRA
jgi:hypothetical protein